MSASSGDGSAVPLRPPRHPVDDRCVPVWRIGAVLAMIPLLAVLAVLVLVIEPLRAWMTLLFGVGVVAAIAYVVAMPRVRHRIHRWEVTEEAVYTKSGWLTQEWRIAPLSRIQTVDATSGPLQQLMGLATVRVTTASAAGAVSIEALDRQLAEQIVEYLTRRTQATPEDGT